jgi:hypothetical protein
LINLAKSKKKEKSGGVRTPPFFAKISKIGI